MFRHYLGGLALAALSLHAQSLTPPPVPTDVQVPAGNTMFMKAAAVGTQNYICLPNATGLGWKFLAPQATLYLSIRWITGDIRQQIATHYLSPNPVEDGLARATWQSSIDSSAVWAKKIGESSDPAFVKPGAIPWFLLQMAGTRNGAAGGSSFAQTTYIQRINTTGGVVPTTACTEVGALEFVPYTADYLFYKKN